MNERTLTEAVARAGEAQGQVTSIVLDELRADREAVRETLAAIDGGRPVDAALCPLRRRVEAWGEPAAPVAANDGGTQ